MSEVHRLPIRILGLRAIPAIPFKISWMLETVVKLGLRVVAMKQAIQGLSNVYTIDGTTAPAYPFLFGESSSDSDTDSDTDASTAPERHDAGAADRAYLEELLRKDGGIAVVELLEKKIAQRKPSALSAASSTSSASTMTALSLDKPEQFAMSWTTFAGVYRDSLPSLKTYAASLDDVDEANRQFWPNIAEHGLAYNLLMLEKVDDSNVEQVKSHFGDGWNQDLEAAQGQGLLYRIDLSIFESLEPQEMDGLERFTPATVTLLQQDPATQDLTPVAIRVCGENGGGAQCYQATDEAWLYALQAAKASVTVYGIWLGHVYHWHIVTAAMQMTMFNTFSEDHPLYQLLAPQSKYLIAFDDVLLLLWEAIAPSTSITSGFQFLELCNTFAKGREYFEDDPINTLKRHGIRQEDFTDPALPGAKPWNKYPIVGYLLDLWQAVEKYVDVFVMETYADDAAVAGDKDLQKWIKESGQEDGGNVQGLPEMDTRAAMIQVLTSLIYRLTAHGNSRLTTSLSSTLLFVANYPPCLQKSTIPEPSAVIDTKELLSYLPKTGTIAQMVMFYFIFVWTAPYEPFVPIDGADTDLFFSGGAEDPRNVALVDLRQSLTRFMADYEDGSQDVNQWALNIET